MFALAIMSCLQAICKAIKIVNQFYFRSNKIRNQLEAWAKKDALDAERANDQWSLKLER